MRVLYARLSARYEGRIDASLGLGDHLLMWRDPDLGGDGSVLIHSPLSGMLPRNWMPAGSDAYRTSTGFVFHRPGVGKQPDERLEVYIESIYWEQPAISTLPGERIKLGDERQFSNLLSKQLHRLGEGFTLVGREVRTPAGPVDLLLTDPYGRPTIVEVKRRRVALADIYQMVRYVNALKTMDKWSSYQEPRGLFVAPVLAQNAKPLIKENSNWRFVRLDYQTLMEASERDPLTNGEQAKTPSGAQDTSAQPKKARPRKPQARKRKQLPRK